ncbi:hypothetical protein J4G33_02325 [Actinotalea sp. BY-33]|uniref:Tetratricopeptide repeat protein n=1 Tax=Actinotalea soli TaxID=2819234 RepID=A0A939LPN8_9CELL|nr:hypothetical protein [Actinotalea soli]MBO1750635.1 hypothetical protein [Actinotalea soli]
MTVTRAEIDELMEVMSDLPELERAAPGAELVRMADELGDVELRFRTRLELVEAYHYTAERHRMFAPFVYVLQQYDGAPSWLTPSDRFRVLWAHKWMVTLLTDHPQVPLEQLETTLEGMRQRYALAGEDLAPVLGCAFVLQAHRHGAAAADREFDAWRRAPRTSLSDCDGCEPTTRIMHHAALGRHEEVRDELMRVMRGDIGCSEQPHSAISESLASLVELGDVEGAASLHRSAYRACRRNPAATGEVARHLHVLARTGAVARGLEVLAEQLDAVERPSTPAAGMELAAAAARLLEPVVAEGDGDLPVRGPGRTPERVADLLVRLREHAIATARRFDQRNGTTAVSERVHAMLTAPALPPLPLGVVGAAPTTAVALPALPDEPEHPELRRDADLQDVDVLGLAERVSLARATAGRPTCERLAAHWEARREAVLVGLAVPATAEALPPDTAAHLRAVADLDAFAAWSSPEPRPVLTASAADLYRRVGDGAEALLAELLDGLRDGRAVDAPRLLGQVDAVGTRGQRARARARLAEDAEPGRARELNDEASRILADGPLAPEDLRLAAHLRLHAETGDAGQDVPTEVLTLLGDAEAPDIRVQLELERASSDAAEGDLLGAHGRLDRAVELGQRAGSPELVLQVESSRCRLLADTGEAPGAEARALAVASAALTLDLHEIVVDCRTLAAFLMARHGREVEAIELAEATLGLPFPAHAVTAGHRRYRAGQRLRLLDLAAELCAVLEESDRALALAREAVDLATGPDGGDAVAAPALGRLAGLLTQGDAVEATRLYQQALEAAVASGQHGLALVVRRERVTARLHADGLDAALLDVQDARRANEEAMVRASVDPAVAADLSDWDEPLEQLTLTTLSARLHASAGDHEQALTVLDGLASRWTAIGADGNALETELLRGSMLLDLDREGDGLPTLAEVAERASELGWPALAQAAAGTGAAWLDEAGRPEEAEAFWLRCTGADGQED